MTDLFFRYHHIIKVMVHLLVSLLYFSIFFFRWFSSSMVIFLILFSIFVNIYLLKNNIKCPGHCFLHHIVLYIVSRICKREKKVFGCFFFLFPSLRPIHLIAQLEKRKDSIRLYLLLIVSIFPMPIVLYSYTQIVEQQAISQSLMFTT